MKFSTRTTYGLRAMINLAKQKDQENLSVARIAKNEGISRGYLERLFARLKKAGLVKAEKGASGGYRLAKSPEQISAHRIINALEGGTSAFYCLDESGKIYCDEKCKCSVTLVLAKVQEAVNKTLKSISLKDLV